MRTFYATPAARCPSPARWFGDARDALDFARRCADAFRVAWTVFEIRAGRPERLAAYLPTRRP